MSTNRFEELPEERAQLLRMLEVHLLETAEERARAQEHLKAKHYLGAVQAVGEQMHYAVSDGRGRWVAVLVFAAAALHLKERDTWIGWSERQRRHRLALVANNVRFLLLPVERVPNLGSAVLARVLDRLSGDWEARYGHPILVVETFVDPERFQGTVYRANNWIELGQTRGNGRKARDYYEKHNKPKRLFARELEPGARDILKAEQMKPSLADVEARVPVRSDIKSVELMSLRDRFAQVGDYRKRIGVYPISTLLAITACAHLAGAPRGQKALEGFAKRLSQPQLRALGVRRNKHNRYTAPSQSTFSRLFSRVDVSEVGRVLLEHQAQVRGPVPDDEIIVLDGKEPKHGGGLNVVTAVSAPGLHYLGSTVVGEKTNEIPAVRQLCQQLDLNGRLVSIDALHTQAQTARELVLDHGADYLLTLKNNQPGVRAPVATRLPFFAPTSPTPPY